MGTNAWRCSMRSTVPHGGSAVPELSEPVSREGTHCGDTEHLLRGCSSHDAGPGVRSGDDPAIPAPIGPRACGPGPGPEPFSSRIVPAVTLGNSGPLPRGAPGRATRPGLRSVARRLLGCDFACRPMPMFFMPAVGVTLRLPERISALFDPRFPLRTHCVTPPKLTLRN